MQWPKPMEKKKIREYNTECMIPRSSLRKKTKLYKKVRKMPQRQLTKMKLIHKTNLTIIPELVYHKPIFQKKW